MDCHEGGFSARGRDYHGEQVSTVHSQVRKGQDGHNLARIMVGLPVGVEGGLTILLILDGDFQAWFWGWNTVRSGQQPDASNMTICSGKTQLGARLGFPVDPDPQSHVSVTCASEMRLVRLLQDGLQLTCHYSQLCIAKDSLC